jgi:hypothetical protein
VALGAHLRELWRHPKGLALVFALSLAMAVWSVCSISLFPPGFKPRNLEMGTASARILVDTPKSTAVDAKADPVALAALTSRASLLGSIIASPPVREFIARRAGITPDQIQAVGPVTPDVPRALPEPGHEPGTKDVLRSTDEYRIDVQVQPTAPIIDIYVQAPSADAANDLARSSVAGLRDYLSTLAAQQQIGPSDQVKLLQLGGSPASVINPGVNVELALVTFFLVLGASSAALLFLTRVRKGWTLAGASAQPAESAPSTEANGNGNTGHPAAQPRLERIP